MTQTVTIDWAALRTAHGNVVHASDALARLCGDAEDVRTAAH
ncbi:MAG: hypothetical protein ACJ72N_25050 [Labedaea sp.]